MIVPPKKTPCHRVNLEILLHGDEESDEFRQSACHVDSCPDCQRQLTELSGDTDHWIAQRDMLRPVVGDEPASGLLCRYRSAEAATYRRSVVDEDSVRTLLGAPSHPEMLGRLGRY